MKIGSFDVKFSGVQFDLLFGVRWKDLCIICFDALSVQFESVLLRCCWIDGLYSFYM